MGNKEAVYLNDVDPPQQVWIPRRIWSAVARYAVDTFVNSVDGVDCTLRLRRRTKGSGSKEISRSLETPPRVIPIVGVLRYSSHRKRVQRLHEQCAKSANKHRRISVHSSNGSIFGEPSRRVGLHQLHHSCLTIRACHTIA
jgi:hypothetical protein